MRFAYKAIDFGARIAFMAMCAKAFWHHFYKDIEQQLRRQKLTLVENAPSLVPTKVTTPRIQRAYRIGGRGDLTKR